MNRLETLKNRRLMSNLCVTQNLFLDQIKVNPKFHLIMYPQIIYAAKFNIKKSLMEKTEFYIKWWLITSIVSLALAFITKLLLLF